MLEIEVTTEVIEDVTENTIIADTMLQRIRNYFGGGGGTQNADDRGDRDRRSRSRSRSRSPRRERGIVLDILFLSFIRR